MREELPKIFAASGSIFVYATTEPSEALLLGGNTATLTKAASASSARRSRFTAIRRTYHGADLLRPADQHHSRPSSKATSFTLDGRRQDAGTIPADILRPSPMALYPRPSAASSFLRWHILPTAPAPRGQHPDFGNRRIRKLHPRLMAATLGDAGPWRLHLDPRLDIDVRRHTPPDGIWRRWRVTFAHRRQRDGRHGQDQSRHIRHAYGIARFHRPMTMPCARCTMSGTMAAPMRCWAHRAAARPRCSTSSPAWCAPSEGRILFNGQDVTQLSTEERNIAQVFQFPVVYDTMTVYDNLAFPLRNSGVAGRPGRQARQAKSSACWS